MIVQATNQQLFVPIAYDYVQSVCLSISPDEYSGSSLTVDPVVPSPATALIVGLSALLFKKSRKRNLKNG